MFSEVIVTLMQIREYHRKHPAARVVDANEEYEALLKEELVVEFSGEVSLSSQLGTFVTLISDFILVFSFWCLVLLISNSFFRKPWVDTWTCMNCSISTLILNLEPKLNTLLTLMSFHIRIISLGN